MIVTFIIIALFIVLGLFLLNGKGAFLIAGYNTMPKEEKEQYDEQALCRFMGKMMFALSFCMLFWPVSELLDAQWLFALGLGLFLAVVLYIVVYVNTGDRFRKR
ncbi:DUF3784 domain-containing protein [Rossellomorea vietnamensis]|uniref:DUF3784 domain-containing protein n=1 Tax=Rossellomorea vietnamensis TaxID=218284 RepID=A0A5D4MAY9_9BACI|nr:MULTISPECIES: DUF3784 domain-containing protein [Bacillaceae]TYR99119.1 DUF3784 domain-containing protein [Rossellomorea vietnamensis]